MNIWIILISNTPSKIGTHTGGSEHESQNYAIVGPQLNGNELCDEGGRGQSHNTSLCNAAPCSNLHISPRLQGVLIMIIVVA